MYLLDTNVVSELRKVRSGKVTPQFRAWAEAANAVDLYVSVVTIEELEIGILALERRDKVQGATLRLWITKHVLPGFSGRILAIDLAVAVRSATLHVPNPRPVRDALIAATALVHGLTVVTRNVADFESTGVSVVNPWDGAGLEAKSRS